MPGLGFLLAPKIQNLPPPFEFPRKAHCRVHGPKGHTLYQAYKPWLRDEFEFRCSYCLTRELWRDDGQSSFSADHVKPKNSYPKLVCEYDNLVYACARCNTLKSTKVGLPDPCRTSLAKHLRHRSGVFIGLTPQGRRLVEYLRLNLAERVRVRLHHLGLFEKQNRLSRADLALFGYPADLPDLSKLKPPKGNSRPAGIKTSHFARQQAGLLPPYY
jgi:HNH endonuclease